MQATTIKLENPLLGEVKKCISKEESLTSFVRKVLEKEIQKRKMIESADQYLKFLDQNPEEKAWLTEWEKEDLLKNPS